MKPHITLQELHEFIELSNQNGNGLNEERYDMLFNLFHLKAGNILTNRDYTVGAMLAVLEKEAKSIQTNFHSSKEKKWSLKIIFNNDKKLEGDCEELSDGLWEAIQYICLQNIEKEKQ